MSKKISNFLDKHRLILVLSVLLLISLIFILVNLYIFFHYKFEALECPVNTKEETCINKDITILKEPEKKREEIFKEYEDNILELKEEYNLPDFNFYTAYYYTLASNIDYTKNERNITLNQFFNDYSNTYKLDEFYKNNNLFYQIFLPYKVI